MNKPLEVDAFGIDIEILIKADIPAIGLYSPLAINLARARVVGAVVENLSLDDKKRFEEYQEQNDPCR